MKSGGDAGAELFLLALAWVVELPKEAVPARDAGMRGAVTWIK